MVDSVKHIPIFRTYQDIVYGIITGYLTWGNWELGPYFKTFSYNSIEGGRLRLSVQERVTISVINYNWKDMLLMDSVI
jgi:hypothetical protein